MGQQATKSSKKFRIEDLAAFFLFAGMSFILGGCSTWIGSTERTKDSRYLEHFEQFEYARAGHRAPMSQDDVAWKESEVEQGSVEYAKDALERDFLEINQPIQAEFDYPKQQRPAIAFDQFGQFSEPSLRDSDSKEEYYSYVPLNSRHFNNGERLDAGRAAGSEFEESGEYYSYVPLNSRHFNNGERLNAGRAVGSEFEESGEYYSYVPLNSRHFNNGEQLNAGRAVGSEFEESDEYYSYVPLNSRHFNNGEQLNAGRAVGSEFEESGEYYSYVPLNSRHFNNGEQLNAERAVGSEFEESDEYYSYVPLNSRHFNNGERLNAGRALGSEFSADDQYYHYVPLDSSFEAESMNDNQFLPSGFKETGEYYSYVPMLPSSRARRTALRHEKIPLKVSFVGDVALNTFYVVRKTDRHWFDVSQRVYGTINHAEELRAWNKNKNLVPGNIVLYASKRRKTDRSKMLSYVEDQKLELSHYRVVKGDSLASIAQKLYGSHQHWSELQYLNQIPDAAEIEVGTKIKYALGSALQKKVVDRQTASLQPSSVDIQNNQMADAAGSNLNVSYLNKNFEKRLSALAIKEKSFERKRQELLEKARLLSLEVVAFEKEVSARLSRRAEE